MANPYRRTLEAGQITFPNGTTWAINERLSKEILEDANYPFEMRAVYSCTKVSRAENGDSKAGMKAVIKVKMQVNTVGGCDCCRDSQPLGPSKFINECTVQELVALSQLGKTSCQSAPRLLDYKEELQNEDDEFPGGYVVWILMTFLPGKPPHDFWELPRAEKARIQKAFKEAISEVYRCGIMPKDEAIRNILWDEEGGRCFIVDFEDVFFRTKATENFLWFVDDDLLPSWDLAERSSPGIDLYGDGSRISHPTPYVRQNTSQGTKDFVEVSLLLAALNRSAPSEPPQVGATAVSETDQQMKRKTRGRKSIRKLLAWCRLRCGGRVLREFMAPVVRVPQHHITD